MRGLTFNSFDNSHNSTFYLSCFELILCKGNDLITNMGNSLQFLYQDGVFSIIIRKFVLKFSMGKL